MYRNLCCYCESEVGTVRADQIEHRRPVDLFPQHVFDWENLHLGCGACNGHKSAKWDAANPILDAVADVPITDHLDYGMSETGVRRIFLTPRGHTTEQHADLNRERLRHARGFVLQGVLAAILAIRNRLDIDPSDIEAANRRHELEDKRVGPYGSLIQWAIETWLDPYVPAV